jgi:hypothetical protein
MTRAEELDEPLDAEHRAGAEAGHAETAEHERDRRRTAGEGA